MFADDLIKDVFSNMSVNSRQRIIQQIYSTVTINGPGKAHPLLLTTRQIHSLHRGDKDRDRNTTKVRLSALAAPKNFVRVWCLCVFYVLHQLFMKTSPTEVKTDHMEHNPQVCPNYGIFSSRSWRQRGEEGWGSLVSSVGHVIIAQQTVNPSVALTKGQKTIDTSKPFKHEEPRQTTKGRIKKTTFLHNVYNVTH